MGRKARYNGKTDASTISGRLRALGYARYKDYLASEHWQAVRRRYFAVEGTQCACGARAVALHHLTYERLGAERLSDLEALCDPCHKARHGRTASGKRKRSRRARPKPALKPARLSTADRRRAATLTALSEWREAGRA